MSVSPKPLGVPTTPASPPPMRIFNTLSTSFLDINVTSLGAPALANVLCSTDSALLLRSVRFLISGMCSALREQRDSIAATVVQRSARRYLGRREVPQGASIGGT